MSADISSPARSAGRHIVPHRLLRLIGALTLIPAVLICTVSAGGADSSIVFERAITQIDAKDGDVFRIPPSPDKFYLDNRDAARTGKPARIEIAGPASPEEMSVRMDNGGGALVLTFAGSTLEVWIFPAPTVAQPSIASVTFANGAQWSQADLLTKVVRTYDAATLKGAGALHGGGGGDTFLFNPHDGSILIDEADRMPAPHNVLSLGPGIDAKTVAVQSDGTDGILLDLGSDDSVQLQSQLLHEPPFIYGVQEVHFADGTVWTAADLVRRMTTVNVNSTAPTGDATATVLDGKGQAGTGAAQNQGNLYGDSGPNVFDSHGSARYIRGGGGGDTFLYDKGYGQLAIDERDGDTAPENTLAFKAGIAPGDVAASVDRDNNVILALNGADQVVIRPKLDKQGHAAFGIQRVTFADGSSMTLEQLLNRRRAIGVVK